MKKRFVASLFGLVATLSGCGFGVCGSSIQTPVEMIARTVTGPLTVKMWISDRSSQGPEVVEKPQGVAEEAELYFIANTSVGDFVRIEARTQRSVASLEFRIMRSPFSHSVVLSEQNGALTLTCTLESLNLPFPQTPLGDPCI